MKKQKSTPKTVVADALKSTQNAITLVALVITIIVLLILAGVTINLTLGNNGIFQTAQKAAKNYTEAQNKELADLNEFNDTVQALGAKLGTIIKTNDNINYTADGAGNIIPVPAGFSPITTEEGQGTKETGFVIRNDVDKNEFVWIPVEGMGYTYNRYALSTEQPESTLDEKTESMKIKHALNSSEYYTEKMPSDEQTSVATYGGYYIGRYEAGITSKTAISSADADNTRTAKEIEQIYEKALSQADKNLYNWVTRDQAKGLAEGVYTKASNNVTSKLCSSYAWDTALKFIASKTDLNSMGGNYKTSEETRKLEKTGYYSANNIYDMGGNAWEWTTENFSNNGIPCVLRGISYRYSSRNGSASIRTINKTTLVGDDNGFRIALFI